MSLQNIKSNKMRTFLTTLGIIIGVTAVIALITIVDGVIGSVMGQFSSLGAGTLSVSITGSSLKKGLTESDLDSIEQLDNVSGDISIRKHHHHSRPTRKTAGSGVCTGEK